MCNYLDNPDKGSSQVTKKLSLSQVESPPMLGSEKLKSESYAWKTNYVYCHGKCALQD